MNSANLPSPAELSALYGSWNPMAVYRGLQNEDLASQFRDQAYADNANQIQAGTLKNEQSQQMNPLLIADQQSKNIFQELVNSAKTNTNASEKLDFENKSALNEQKMEVERAKLKSMLSEEQINTISNQVLKDHMQNIKSGDLVKIQETGQLLDLLTGTAGKVADRVQNRQLREGDWINSQINSNIAANSRIDAAGMRNEGKAPTSWQSQFAKIKNVEQKNLASSAIITGRNPLTGELLNEDDLKFFEAVRDSSIATLDAANAARGNAQGITAGVGVGGNVELKNKDLPSSGGQVQKMSDDDLINKYLKK